MPLREYVCRECGKVFEELFNDKYPKSLKCSCGGRAEYRLGAPAFKFDFWAGWDDGAGAYFNSQRERDNEIAKKGLRRIKD